jgi:Flp pilus assembly protein TadG
MQHMLKIEETRRSTLRRHKRRRGATAVEVAITLPIFVMFLAAMLEFGHFFLVSHMVKAAAKSGARYGSTLGVTNAQVTTKVNQIIGSAFNAAAATVIVANASVFDTSTVSPSNINYSTLPSIDLTQCNEGDLYVVRVTVPYNSVALLPPFWIVNKTVVGQSVFRHE